MLDDGLPTETSTSQVALEKKVYPLYAELEQLETEEINDSLLLLRNNHVKYLHSGLGELPGGFTTLDASRPWICYWLLHSLALLNAPMPDKGPTADEVVDFLACCQDKRGGYGGGPLQMPHLAPTYAAVCALVTIGSEHALSSINREALLDFLQRMCIPEENGGGFSIHEGGEGDLRACYIAMAIAHMLSLDKDDLVKRSSMVQYVKRCQTFEGGLGGEPHNEAHGGYTFCGLAAMYLAGQATELDLPRLIHWACQRQGSFEGGFNGRTNKLVDGCYSFWQGGLFNLLQQLVPQLNRSSQNVGAASASGAGAPSTSSSTPRAPLAVPRVPPLPLDTVGVSPVEQAQAILAAKNNWAHNLVVEALKLGDATDSALTCGATSRQVQETTSQARVLLDKAADAQREAEQAHKNALVAAHSACVLFPVPDPSDPSPPMVALPSTNRLTPNPLMYNYKALQLWILRCCQQPKGGLKDKPGKQADYYHTCYCLSGLSAAQHGSNCVLGPRENLLKRAEPACNVVEEQLQAARRYFDKKDSEAKAL
eukprot:gene13781-19689_t